MKIRRRLGWCVTVVVGMTCISTSGAALAEAERWPLPSIEAVQPAVAMPAGGREVWDAPNFNRRNYSGAVFHVDHAAVSDAALLRVRYRAETPLLDGKPAPLELRVFDPHDRCVLAADLSRAEPQWYEARIDLASRPAGRYRFSIAGYHRGLTLAAEPARPIGVVGAYALGLPGDAGDQYLHLPADANFWELWVGATKAGQTIHVYNERDERVRSIDVPANGVGWERVRFDGVRGDTTWRLQFAGGPPVRVAIFGVPGVLWPDRASADSDGDATQTIAGRRVSHAWQRPMAQWLAERSDEDFALRTQAPARPDFAALSDEAALRLVPMVGLYGPLSQAENLLRHQVVDPASPRLGLFVDDPGAAPGDTVSPDWSAPFADAR